MAPKMLEDEDIELLRKVHHPLPPQKIIFIHFTRSKRKRTASSRARSIGAVRPTSTSTGKEWCPNTSRAFPTYCTCSHFTRALLRMGQLVVLSHLCVCHVCVMCPQEGEQRVVGE
jgi:hypothetical protein